MDIALKCSREYKVTELEQASQDLFFKRKSITTRAAASMHEARKARANNFIPRCAIQTIKIRRWHLKYSSFRFLIFASLMLNQIKLVLGVICLSCYVN